LLIETSHQGFLLHLDGRLCVCSRPPLTCSFLTRSLLLFLDGYPLSPATSIALSTVRDYLVSPSGESVSAFSSPPMSLPLPPYPRSNVSFVWEQLDRVIFVVFSQRDFDLYSSLIPLYFPLHEALEERASEEIRWA
jgi:hypothetical protein